MTTRYGLIFALVLMPLVGCVGAGDKEDMTRMVEHSMDRNENFRNQQAYIRKKVQDSESTDEAKAIVTEALDKSLELENRLNASTINALKALGDIDWEVLFEKFGPLVRTFFSGSSSGGDD